MALQVCSLGSGSKGNCVLITDGKTKILLDAGLSSAAIIKRLAALGYSVADIDALLVTHEHDDHIRSVEALSDKIPVYSHADTLEQVAIRHPIPLKNMLEIDEGTEISIGTLDITPFRVSHDAAHPFGYVIKDWENKFTYVTDTGYVSKGIMNAAQGSDIVMIESNHDAELLLRGGYPEYLKRRILSEKGHLSNVESARTVYDLIVGGAKYVALAHLSEQNNLAELAYWTTKNFLRARGIDDGGYRLKVAMQHETVVVK